MIIVFLLIISTVYTATSPESSEKQKLKKLPIGVDVVDNVINEGYVYVDKTNFILKLIQQPSKFVFLNRPRQFGKTLLVSTIGEIFRHTNKELFKDTEIYKCKYEWTSYPVIKIDFSRIARNFLKDFLDSVKQELIEVRKSYGLPNLYTPNITLHIVNLTRTLYEKFGKPVVLLIEEYDCTYAEEFGLPDGANEILKYTRHFYKAVKSESKIVRLCFVISPTEFSKASTFSGFNGIGLVDISSEPDYAEITGFTKDEIEKNFGHHIEAIAKHDNVPEGDLYKEIQSWYNRYQFSSKDIPVYCPHSILTYLEFKKNHDIFGFRWGLNFNIDAKPGSTVVYLPPRSSTARIITISNINSSMRTI